MLTVSSTSVAQDGSNRPRRAERKPRGRCLGTFLAGMRFSQPTRVGFLTVAFWMLTAVVLHAQTYTVIANFDLTTGGGSDTPLVQGADGNFYGTTPLWGTNEEGTVFKVTPAGVITVLYNFCSEPSCADGAEATGPLTLGSDGNLYGTTFAGGRGDAGTVFKITPTGDFKVLYSFCSEPQCADGFSPAGTLLEAGTGRFYGTTSGGGMNSQGTVFQVSPTGELRTVYSFCALPGCADGTGPFSGFVQANNGNFLGTTYGGGQNAAGTVFQIGPPGRLTTIYSFVGDGGAPVYPVVPGPNGNLYGAATDGGTAMCSYLEHGCGDVYQVSPESGYSTLYSFCTQEFCPDGAYPECMLLLATDENLYGTTSTGGLDGGGTIFSVTPSGTVQTLYNFDGFPAGGAPVGGLIQATDGTIYGTTSNGGSSNQGTIFSFSSGLLPFIGAVPAEGGVGTRVLLLGSNLTGTTSVTFNGVAADFTVLSGTAMTATVPAGSTTGKIEVTTSNGPVSSKTSFVVLE